MLFSVKYSKFGDAAALVHSLGRVTYMAKLDIKHAFRLCPVHPEDWPHLGYFWANRYFVNVTLPFGSRSLPFLFNQFADVLLWILIAVYGIPFVIHYLDDFFLCNVTASSCQADMGTLESTFSELGVPLAPGKVVGSVTQLTYLGIEIDSRALCVRLPSDKLFQLQFLLQSWHSRKKCTKRDLLSLIGSLSFACKVVKPSRIFLRLLIDLSTSATHLHHHITLNTEARARATWWLSFLPDWNGVELIHGPPTTSHSLQLFTDASSLGFGAVYENQWLYSKWPKSFADNHINFLELFAILAAIYTWGSAWSNTQIIFYTDNSCIVQIWRSGSCRDKSMMRLVRALFLFTARRNLNGLMQHIPGHTNIWTGALSRLQVRKFHQLHRQAQPEPTSISSDVWLL